jgi:hypothetical protein
MTDPIPRFLSPEIHIESMAFLVSCRWKPAPPWLLRDFSRADGAFVPFKIAGSEGTTSRQGPDVRARFAALGIAARARGFEQIVA